MKEITVGIAQESSKKARGTLKSSEDNGIQRYYRQIGIPAVAAAVRYQGESKNRALRLRSTDVLSRCS